MNIRSKLKKKSGYAVYLSYLTYTNYIYKVWQLNNGTAHAVVFNGW